MLCLVTQLCLTLCDPMDCRRLGSSVHGILQTRILEWIAIPFTRGIFPTQELNRGPLHYRQILYQLSYQGSPHDVLVWFIISAFFRTFAAMFVSEKRHHFPFLYCPFMFVVLGLWELPILSWGLFYQFCFMLLQVLLLSLYTFRIFIIFLINWSFTVLCSYHLSV